MFSMTRRICRVPAALLLCVFASATTAAISLISVDQEIAIGKEADAQVRKEVPALGDAGVNAYVRGVAPRQVQVAPGPK